MVIRFSGGDQIFCLINKKQTTTTTPIDRSHVKWMKKKIIIGSLLPLDLIRFHVNVALIAHKKWSNRISFELWTKNNGFGYVIAVTRILFESQSDNYVCGMFLAWNFCIFENRIVRIYADSHGKEPFGRDLYSHLAKPKMQWESFIAVNICSTLLTTKCLFFFVFLPCWFVHTETANKLVNLPCACVKMDNFFYV